MPLRFHTIWLLSTLLLLPNGKNEAVVEAFSGSSGEVGKPASATASLASKSNAMWRRTRLFAKPERLQENVKGVVYVNDKVSRCRSLQHQCVIM
jgi:hypothetical protein